MSALVSKYHPLSRLVLFLLLAALPLSAMAEDGIRISGTVMDNQKEPLIGVSISVDGTTLGTITDFDGHFYLTVPDKKSKLNISYIGYKTQVITVGSDINFTVTLLEDNELLDEVVVVGYGNQKKLSVIGSIQTLEPQQLQVGSTRSMSNNLAGQLAGVIAVQPSGEPGYDNSNFWIRGIASFSGNASPGTAVRPRVYSDPGPSRPVQLVDPAGSWMQARVDRESRSTLQAL